MSLKQNKLKNANFIFIFICFLCLCISTTNSAFTASYELVLDDNIPTNVFFYGENIFVTYSPIPSYYFPTPMLVVRNAKSGEWVVGVSIPVECNPCESEIIIKDIQIDNNIAKFFVVTTSSSNTQIITYNLDTVVTIDYQTVLEGYNVLLPDLYNGQSSLISYGPLTTTTTIVEYTAAGNVVVTNNKVPFDSYFSIPRGVVNITEGSGITCSSNSFFEVFNTTTNQIIQETDVVNCKIFSVSTMNTTICTAYNQFGLMNLACWNYSEYLNVVPNGKIFYNSLGDGEVFAGVIDPLSRYYFLGVEGGILQIDIRSASFNVMGKVGTQYNPMQSSSVLPYSVSTSSSHVAMLLADEAGPTSVIVATFDDTS